MRRLKELESEVHSMHISDGSSDQPANKTAATAPHNETNSFRIPSVHIFSACASPLASPQRSRPIFQPAAAATPRPTGTDTDKDVRPLTSPDRTSKASTAHTDTEASVPPFPSTNTNPPDNANANANPTPSTEDCESTPAPAAAAAAATPAHTATATDEEFQNFCLQLSQAASPQEVQHILHHKHATPPSEDEVRAASSAHPRPFSYSSTPTTALTQNSPHAAAAYTPVSVATLLSPLGSRGSGTMAKVALSDLATYQSKLSTWRKRYPVTSSGGGGSSNSS